MPIQVYNSGDPRWQVQVKTPSRELTSQLHTTATVQQVVADALAEGCESITISRIQGMDLYERLEGI